MKKELITLMSKFVNKKQIDNNMLKYILLENNKLVAINGYAMLIVEMKYDTNLNLLLDVTKQGKDNDDILHEYPANSKLVYPTNSKLVNNYPNYNKLLVTEKIKEIEIQSEAYTYDKETKLVKASYIICKIAKNNLYFDVETIIDFLIYDKIEINYEFKLIFDDSKFQLDGEFGISSEKYKFTYVQMLMK